MRPLIVAEPMLRAPSPEIVSESNLGTGVCAIVAVAGTRASTNTQNQSLEFVFIGKSSWMRNVSNATETQSHREKYRTDKSLITPSVPPCLCGRLWLLLRLLGS